MKPSPKVIEFKPVMTTSLRSRYWQLRLAAGLAIVGAVGTVGDRGIAQIKPDATLGAERSVVTPQSPSSLVDEIKGGAVRGANLFHSFEQFSVLTGRTAYFNNALQIQNIISRVTGGSVSNIDGVLKANGTANVFLINPNGIIFGPNASLNIGGSFLASTASSLNFADGSQFRATAPQANPLLTISVPLGLQFGGNPGAIRVQGTGNDQTSLARTVQLSPVTRGSSLTGLQVQPGKTLALVGGDVALEGGTLTAEQGQIELGSVSDGRVRLSPTTKGWTLGYEGVQSFQDIQLSQRALADASGAGGGDIQLSGRRVTLTGGSLALIQNQGLKPAGSLNVNASESVEVIDSGLLNETVGVGNAGDIAVSTKRLIIQDGGGIVTRTFSAASGGKLTVNASESVQLIGVSPFNRSIFSILGAATSSSGDAGDITVSTGRFTAKDGGAVVSATLGTGSGGNVTVNATESVELIGVERLLFEPSALSASTFNAGNAGRLTINTSRLAVRDGGRVDSSTAGSGSAGSVTINASESVEVSGKVPGSRNPSLVISSANIADTVFQQAFGLPPVPSGASGDVTINTLALSVTDGALVNVRNDGSGNGGTLRVNARSIVLDNLGGITAATAFGKGGNISLQVQDLLQMRHNSQISANAGSNQNGGNGGNININTPFIIAVPSENSDITANARSGKGGNVNVLARGIFWLEPLSLGQLQTLRPNDLDPSKLPTNDITAISQQGGPSLSGQVNINTSGIDPSRGLVALPAVVVDKSGLIAQGCAAGDGTTGSQFIVTGRGGLPPNPGEPLSSDAVWSDARLPVVTVKKHRSQTVTARQPSTPAAVPIVPATGWVFNGKGEVTLTASAPSDTIQIPWITPATCHAQ